MNVRGVSDWENEKVEPKAFFLGKEEFPKLYADAKKRYKKYLKAVEKGEFSLPKKVLPPAEQLSAKGLALMSYLYAQKDKSEVQPLVADSVANLKHISKLIDDAPVGTSVTVIFQPTNKEDPKLPDFILRRFSSLHKTVVKIERTNEGVRLIHMDGTNSSIYTYATSLVISAGIEENAEKKGKKQKIDAYIALAKDLADPSKDIENQGRQKTNFECGIFAKKDARELNRDAEFYERHLKEVEPNALQIDEIVTYYDYEMPTKYMKSSQSITDYRELLKELGDTVVTRKNKTLQQTFDKHVDSYANHFALKYNEQILKFLEGKNPDEVKAAVEQYDAGKITMERLLSVYGPKQAPELTDAVHESTSLKIPPKIG